MLSPVDEIKARLDLVTIIGEYVQLKNAGANMKGICPFHQEKTPSFMVSRSKQIWHCFGCGLGGDMFSFIQQIEGVEFPEALRILAEKAGVKLDRQDPVAVDRRARLAALLQDAVRYFHAQLLQSSSAEFVRTYLKDTRKLTPETIEGWRLGYSPDSWDATSQFLVKRGFTMTDLRDTGMLVERTEGKSSTYDRFRNRLMFPIYDHNAMCVGFTARTLEEGTEGGAKYINTPQTLLYDKSKILYGIDKAKQSIRESRRVVVVEGNMDAVASHQAGVRNVVASSGTALTRDQVVLLKRYADTIILAFDMDAAGINAMMRGIEVAWNEGLEVLVASMPEEGTNVKDPDDLIRQDPQQWQAAIRGARPVMDVVIERKIRGVDMNRASEKQRIGDDLLGLVARMPHALSRDHYLQVITEGLHADEYAVRETLRKIMQGQSRTQRGTASAALEGGTHTRLLRSRQEVLTMRLLAHLTIFGDDLTLPIDAIRHEWIADQWRTLYSFLVSYYTTNRGFVWDAFMTLVRSEVPEQHRLWSEIGLMGEGLFVELEQDDRMSDYQQSLKQLQYEYVKKRREELKQQVSRIEQQIARTEGDGERAVLTKELEKLISEFTLITGELSLGG